MTRADPVEQPTPLEDWAPSCYAEHQRKPCQVPAAWHETVSCHRCQRRRWTLACPYHHDELIAGRVRCTDHSPALLHLHGSAKL